MTESMSWVMFVRLMVVCAASMPKTPPFSATALIRRSSAIRLLFQTPLAPMWLAMIGILEAMTAS